MTLLFQKHRNLLPLLGLAAGCCYTLYDSLAEHLNSNGDYYHNEVGYEHYAGIIALLSCFSCYFFFRSFFKYALVGTLLLGTANFLSFMLGKTSFGLGFGGAAVSIQPLSFLLLLTCYFLNIPAANAFLRQYIVPAPSPKQAAAVQHENISQFKATFSRKSDDSLRQLLTDNKLVPDALAAARELLAERERQSLTTPQA